MNNQFGNQQNGYAPPAASVNQQPNINMNMNNFLQQMKKKYHFTALFVISVIETVFIPLFGILGLVFTNIMKDAFIVGDFIKADKYAKYSKIILIIGGVLYVLMIVAVVVFYIWLFSVFFSMIGKIY